MQFSIYDIFSLCGSNPDKLVLDSWIFNLYLSPISSTPKRADKQHSIYLDYSIISYSYRYLYFPKGPGWTNSKYSSSFFSIYFILYL